MTTELSKASPLDIFAELISYTQYLTGTPPLETDAERVVQVMESLLRRSQHKSAEVLGWGKAEWLEGFFPVAAWIDERLQSPAWSGHRVWVKQSLQRRYFSSAVAGEEFFQRLEGLDSNQTGLREIYDFCLGLGFHGRFFENKASDQQVLEDIRRANLTKFNQDDPDLNVPPCLFPADPATRLTTPRRSLWSRLSIWFWWLLPVFLVLALYYLLSVRFVDLIPSG